MEGGREALTYGKPLNINSALASDWLVSPLKNTITVHTLRHHQGTQTLTGPSELHHVT